MPEAYRWRHCALNLLTATDSVIASDGTHLTSPWLHVNPDGENTLVWLIENNRACPWPLEDYGQFFQESVYLVLTIKPTSQGTQRDLHIWIGKYATEADYMAAFVRAQELRERLGHLVHVHRQVQGRETTKFLDVFNPTVYWKGNPRSGYRQCKLRQLPYTVKMLQLYKPDVHAPHIIGKEVPCNVRELDPAYTYCLDTGGSMYLWQSDMTETQEDIKSIRFMEDLRVARGGGMKVEVLNEEQKEGHAFFNYLSQDGYKREDHYQDEDSNSTLHRNSMLLGNSTQRNNVQRKLVCLYHDPKTANRKKRKSTPASILHGDYRTVKEGRATMKDFVDGDIFLYDEGDRLWIWISSKALDAEKKLALQFGHDYLRSTDHPFIPFTVVLEDYPDVELSALLRLSAPASQNGRQKRNGVHFEDS